MFVAAIALTLTLGPENQRYDANEYWLSSNALVSSRLDPSVLGDFRGVLSAFVFLPAAVAWRLFPEVPAGTFILIQNAVLMGLISGALIPSLLGEKKADPRLVWVSGVTAYILALGFLQFSLMDLYAASAMIGAIGILAMSTSWRRLVVAGLLLGIAVNIRPAYLVAAVVVVLLMVAIARRQLLPVAIGTLVATIPQIVHNIVSAGSVSPLPAASNDLTALQAGYASWVIRYDTVIRDESPRQFYCSPEMAERAESSLPESASELALFLLGSLPESLLFAWLKIASSLHWNVATTYVVESPIIDAAYAALVIGLVAVTVVTIGTMLWRARKADSGIDSRFALYVTAAMTGTVLTLVASATEARFALPLVLLSLIVVARFGRQAWRPVGDAFNWRDAAPRVGIITVLIAAIAASGVYVLSSPMPPGPQEVSDCVVSNSPPPSDAD